MRIRTAAVAIAIVLQILELYGFSLLRRSSMIVVCRKRIECRLEEYC